MDIKLLDCTLRDGGFVNNWNFGHNNILWIYQRLNFSNIDIVEIGYLRNDCLFNKNRTVFPDITSIDTLLSGIDKKSIISVMFDCGEYDDFKIPFKNNSIVDAIRITFKKNDTQKALECCKRIKEKGYLLFIQPVSITSYSDREMLELIEKINEVNPYALSIVDTYGLLHKDNLIKYFYLMDNNLNSQINIGYHSHNNFQLGYSNAIELLNIKTSRTFVLDASLYGMGKRAGNTCTELLSTYLNEHYNKNYDINELLEIIDIEILKIRKKYSWGYSLSSFLAASNDCHPSYVKFLQEKHTIPIKAINTILNSIDKDKKLSFDEEHIKKLYNQYQCVNVDDSLAYENFKKKYSGKKFLLLGPGKSIKESNKEIKQFIINNKDLIIISINHVCDFYPVKNLFVSNAKRYEQLTEFLLKNKDTIEVSATSNITAINGEIDYLFNYEKILSDNPVIADSSLILLLNILKTVKVKEIYLAGFDGFSDIIANDYYDEYFEFSDDKKDKNLFNHALALEIEKLNEIMKITFLTKSLYNGERKC